MISLSVVDEVAIINPVNDWQRVALPNQPIASWGDLLGSHFPHHHGSRLEGTCVGAQKPLTLDRHVV